MARGTFQPIITRLTCAVSGIQRLGDGWYIPSGAVASTGQVASDPEHTSSGSHSPVLYHRQSALAISPRSLMYLPLTARHTVPCEENWQVSWQQSSLLGSQTEPVVNLHVVGSQHVFEPQDSSPPQSQSSPLSTIPLPHWLPVIVVTSLFAERQVVFTLLRPIAEHMLPIVQAENFVIPLEVDGFMIYASPASHVELLRGQHCYF